MQTTDPRSLDLDSSQPFVSERQAQMAPWPNPDHLVVALAEHVRRYGSVFRLPAPRPTYVLGSREGLRAMADAELVERTPVDLPRDGYALIPGASDDAAGPRRRSAWASLGALDHAGLGEFVPRLRRCVDEVLDGWSRLGVFSLNHEAQRASWRVATLLVLGRDDEGPRLADVDARSRADHPAEREAAARRLLEWCEREAAGAAGSSLAARLAASGELSRAELACEIDRSLAVGLLASAPVAELLLRLARDRALCGELRTEARALGDDHTPSAMSRTPRLLRLIDEALRVTTPVPILHGRALKDLRVDGVSIPAGASLVGAAHAVNQLGASSVGDVAFGVGPHAYPAASVATLSTWLFATRALRAFDLRALDDDDSPTRQPDGFFAPRGAFVRFGRGLLPAPARAPSSRAPTLPVPPTTPPPPTADLDARVAIVGAGISGLTVAHELRKRGFRRVTVFERAPAVGGKADTVTIDGRPYNLGAHLCHGSLGVAALGEEVGVPMERTTSYVLWDIDNNRAVPRRYQDMAEFDKLRRLLAARPSSEHDAGFAAEQETYPSVDRWLAVHDLGALREVGPFFTGAGYGFMDEDIPAGFFLKFAQHMTEDGWTPAGGYKHLLERVADGLDVRCATEVARVERSATEGVRLATRPAGTDAAPTHETFDRLVLTGPLEHSAKYLEWTAEESALFSRVRSDDYFTVLATLTIASPHEPGLYIVPGNTATRGEGGRTTAFVRLYEESTVYHFFGYGEPGQTDASILDRVRDDARKLGGEIAEVHVFRKWAYAPRVSPHDMALGYHRRLDRMQGQNATYYAGSLLAFELTDHNVLFAKSLVERFFPAPSERPEVAPAKAAPTDVDPLCRVPERGTQSILEVLRDRYEKTPDAVLSTFLDARGREVRALSYRTLVERATACAVSLVDAGVKAGDRVALVYPPDTDEFLVGFFGTLFAGAIAVPVASPDPRSLDVEIPRFAHLVSDCDCRVALTTRFYYAAALAGRAWHRLTGGANGAQWPKLTWIRTDGLSPIAPTARRPIPAPSADAVAYLQYTSGSTSAPKGVMIRHGNILHNVEAIRRQASMNERSVLVGWVPLFHDMGLVGGPLNALYSGAHMVFFSPMAFLQNPRLWVEAMSRYRATHTESPNFGYEFLLRRIEGDALEGIDLSSLTHALFGGEAMRHRTFERMAERLHGTGFRPESMINIFGAAEATLFLAGGGGEPPLLSVATRPLQSARRAAPCSPDAASTTLLIGCRIPADACDLRVVDPESTRLLPDREVGEIWLSSPSVAQGYWGRSTEDNDRGFRARVAGDASPLRTYLRTGDLGFIDRGVLYICGRLKEMMIFEGRNIYPMDVEASVMNAHPAIRQGCVAAFSVEESDRERLVVVAELKANAASGAAEAASAIALAVAHQHHLTCKAIVLVRGGSLPKTSSGKLQRYRAREAYLSRRLQVTHEQTPDATTLATTPGIDAAADTAPSAPFRGNADETRRWLQRLVASTLHIAPDEVDTSVSLAMFGVESAQALSLVVKISDYVGRELPPSVFFEHQTIDALVGYLCGDARPESRLLVPLRRGDPARSPTLFCVHPVGGSAMAYLGLVAHLPEHVPVYAFDSDGGDAPGDDLAAMARRYVAELRAVQAEGPYYLVGYSFGGTVAFEMSRQMLAAGAEVRGLFMVDSPAPLYAEAAAEPRSQEAETYARFLESAILNRVVSDELDDDAREQLRQRVEQNHRAHASYRVEPGDRLTPDITFFRASDEAPNLRDHLRHPAFDRPDFGWEEASPGTAVRVTPVPGDHFSVMREPAALAAFLARAIETA